MDEVLREQCGEELLQLVQQDRLTAIRWREGVSGAAEALGVRVRGRPPRVARDLVRAFSAWFQLVNVAEKVHRIRRRRQYFQQDGDRPQPGGVEDALAQLKATGLSLEDVLKLLAQLSIEPVVLAHPMESTRRTTLRRQQRLARLLLERDNATLAPHEHRTLIERIRAEVSAEWQTEEHPRERLTVADEREHAIYYLAEIFYPIIPAFYQQIAAALGKLYGTSPETLELPVIVRFGSGVGGDMEFSGDVHAKSIRETLARAQQVIINKYYDECQQLAQTLSQSANRVSISSALMRRMEEYRTLLPGSQSITPSRHDRMPYRVLLGLIAERLHATYDGRSNGYQQPGQFRADIALIAQSLLANRGAHAGYFLVRRLLYRIDTFGFHLATLDLRAHTRVHHAVLAQGLDDPAWVSRSAAERHTRLPEILERDIGPVGSFDALGKRTLAVFDAIPHSRHRYGADAIGLYIVSGAADAIDVLAPLVLARWAGACDKSNGEVALDVAPLFDGVETLERCGAIDAFTRSKTASIWAPPGSAWPAADGVDWLRRQQSGERHCGLARRRLPCRAAAERGALRQAEKQHVLLYSRGGSLPQGGGRIDAMLRAAPAESVSGVLRFTEKGESLSQNYGLQFNAMRALERALSTLALATLAVNRGVAVREGAALAECASLVAERSARVWRSLVYEQPRFVDFFRAVSPDRRD